MDIYNLSIADIRIIQFGTAGEVVHLAMLSVNRMFTQSVYECVLLGLEDYRPHLYVVLMIRQEVDIDKYKCPTKILSDQLNCIRR